MPRKLTDIKRVRLNVNVDTEELQAVLSRATITKIENDIPVSYKSAALYCKALGVDPEEYIIQKRLIRITEEPQLAS